MPNLRDNIPISPSRWTRGDVGREIGAWILAEIKEALHLAGINGRTIDAANIVGTLPGLISKVSVYVNDVLVGARSALNFSDNFEGVLDSYPYLDSIEAVNIDLSDTGVTPGTYGDTDFYPTLVVDSKGRITAVGELSSTPTARTFSPALMMFEYDDFVSGPGGPQTLGNGKLNWNGPGAALNPSPVAGEAGHPGIMRSPTGALNNSLTYFTLLTNTASFLPAEAFETLIIFRQNIADTTNGVRIGVAAQWNAAPNDGIYLEKLAADTQWYAVTKHITNGTTRTALASCDANWHKIRIRRIDASTIGFTLDALTEVTHTATIPTAACNVGWQCFNSASNALVRTLDADYADLLITGLNR